ncbi:vicilin-like [Cicer arietinum]|uniref:Vicilin-like n=1 Tax=Cicer arietinum TaxID=3827 RepID=A0A1S2Y087_CICAR|nr:vicilin-like [Cicer arietinum]
MATTTKTRFPLLLLLGIIFLASVCVSYGIVQYEQGNPCLKKCMQRYNKVNEAFKRREEEEYEERSEHSVPGQRERGRQEGEKEEEHREQRRSRRESEREREEDEQKQRHPHHEREEEEDEEFRERRHRGDTEETRFRRRKERRQEQQEKKSESKEDEEESSSESQGRRNPFFFRSNKFQTIFENQHGHIRLLQNFDKRSNLFQNLQNYRFLEYKARPHTLLLPQHIDADFILVVLSGKAILTVLNPNDRNSFNLERGDTIKLPAGTTAYLANHDDEEDLRVVELAIPVNRPGKFQSFFPSSNQNQQSYFNGFSKSILEASFNTKYETIERVLLEEQEPEQSRGRRGSEESEEGDAIVKVSREQIEELSKHAKSSSRKSISSESEPFNLRSRNPIYSNKFGKFFEITPEKSPQLQDLNIFVSCVEINEGGLMLPHFNSRAIVVLFINEGKGHLELVGLRNEQQEQQQEEDEEQEEEERNNQVQRFRARLSPGDVFIIPAGHPVAVNASSDLNFVGFGINAENNQRNFLAGEDDNVISQIQNPVKELTFPGSAQEVNRLIKNQRQSYFANAQPQQREEESQRRRGSLSSILGGFY